MIIERHDNNHFIIGCNDKDLLKKMQGVMNGFKVRNVNKIIIPLKSGPKIFRFKNYDIRWGPNTKDTILRLSANIIKRKQNIEKIKSQYGKEIKFDYDCKGLYVPMAHQKIMYNMIAYNDVVSILADVGTCKTGPYLWAIDARIIKKQIKKALVITLTDLKKNVMEEMKVQVPHLTGVILNNKVQANKVINKQYKIKKKNIDYHIYIANYEKMFSLVEVIPDDYFDMVILDEAHRIGSPNSRQTENIIKKFEFSKYKYIVTASLNANNLMSFFMPFRFLGPDTVPYAHYGVFREEHMHSVDPNGYIWVPNDNAVEKVSKIIGNLSVMFQKEECLDLPPIIREKYSCDMEPNQLKLYTQMKNDLVTIIDDMCEQCDKKDKCDDTCEQTMVAKNALVLREKLRQIASGFYINTRFEINDNGKRIAKRNVIYLDENPKLRLLINTLNNIPTNRKVIIWSNYVPGINLIKKAVGNAFGDDSYLTCYLDEDAYEQVQLFRQAQYKYLIANQTKMGHGHNIQFSNYQVFFCNDYSYVKRDQAEGRQHRKGQDEKVTIIDIVMRKSVDEIILKALSAKKDLSLTLSQWARVLKRGPDTIEF